MNLSALFASAALLLSLPARAAEIWLVVDTPVQRTPPSVRVIELQAVSLLSQRLNQGLPGSPHAGSDEAQRRLKAEGLQQRMSRAHQDITDAWTAGVRFVPAVVVDRRYVVYGTTDVSRALALISNFRANQP